jgi:hypothetical protein
VVTLDQIGLATNIRRYGSTYASGKITAQAEPSTRHPSGTNVVAHTTMPPRMTTETITENQNLIDGGDMYVRTQGTKRPKKLPHRFIIFGTSLKKLERSTSFFVAPHVILYENKWARIAWLKGMLSPPKKKKLVLKSVQVLTVIGDNPQER